APWIRSSRRRSSNTTAKSVATCTSPRTCCSPSATATRKRSPPAAGRTRPTAERPRTMNTLTALFYVFSAVLLASSFRVITARDTVHAALFLVLAFFSAACVWMLLTAEFLAIALVLVYVGAVMVLFLFVVMMLDTNADALRVGFWKHFPLAGLIAALIALEMALVLMGGFR